MQWRGNRGSKNSLVEQGNGPKITNIYPVSGVFNSDTIFQNKNNSKWPVKTHQKRSNLSSAAGESQLWAWGIEQNRGSGGGYGSFGTSGLSTGRTAPYGTLSPIQVGSRGDWLNIKGSEKNNLIVSAAGKIYTSGINWNGALGVATGATGSVYTAGQSGVTQLGALTNWNYPAVGDGHVGAVKTDGTLWTWGAGAYGQTGLGVTTAYSSPKQVGALTDWSAAFLRKNHSFAIKTNGTLWAWGKNSNGQLGVGNTTNYSSPKQVGALTDWAKIFPCEQGAFALKTDGTLWAWGDVHVFGSSVPRSSPVQISNDKWNNISVAYRPATFSSFTNTLVAAGIKSDGSLWVVENAGTSGLSGVVSKNIYDWIRIGTSNNWSRVSVGRTSNAGTCWIAAIKNDGTLWTWGNGGNGRLGLGNQTSYSSPKQVGALTTWIDVFHFGLRTMALRS